MNAYHYILGREPESDAAILSHMHIATIGELRTQFLQSAEFSRLFSPHTTADTSINAEEIFPPQDLAPIRVDVDADPSQLEALLGRIKQEWEQFGKDEPYWSVLTHDAYKYEQLEANKDHFFASGRFVQQIISTFFERNKISIDSLATCLELGCGVGRITVHLSKMFKNVVGADISKFHLDLCREEMKRNNIDNVGLCCLTNVDELQKLQRFDFFCSFIVLQHNPPPVIKLLLEYILQKLNPGGIAIFQIPTYRRNYEFNIARYVEESAPLHMEMHVLPQPEVFSILRESKCDLLEVREDGWAEGRTANSLSNTFFVRKRAA